mmetsp:Transcript_13296/g.20064  ORF Transcript_13296/g.20064 Transcript_13296/m.20064 type:complete len:220 (-) Transcript_13296:209-868(-)
MLAQHPASTALCIQQHWYTRDPQPPGSVESSGGRRGGRAVGGRRRRRGGGGGHARGPCRLGAGRAAEAHQDEVLHLDGRGHAAGAGLLGPHGGPAVGDRPSHRRGRVLHLLRPGAHRIQRQRAGGRVQLRQEAYSEVHELRSELPPWSGCHEQHLLPGHLPGAGLLPEPRVGVHRRDAVDRSHPAAAGPVGLLPQGNVPVPRVHSLVLLPTRSGGRLAP